MAIEDDVIVVGARQHDHGQGLNAGAAYVFEWNGSSWEFSVELLRSDAVVALGATEFASHLRISGDTIVVGSLNDDASCNGAGTDCGAAYVYVRPGSEWRASPINPVFETAKLVSNEPSNGAHLGHVAIDGGLIVVGADSDTHSGVIDTGSVYVFPKPAGGWSGGAANPIQASARINSIAPAYLDEFGVRVAVREAASDGDLVVIGARSKGAAYVVPEPLTGWMGTIWVSPNLIPSQDSPRNLYGTDVAIDGPSILVGAAGGGRPVAGSAERAGMIFVFERKGSAWVETHWLQVPAVHMGGLYSPAFGHATALNRTTVVAGAPFDDNSSGVDAGSAFIFNLRP